MGMLQDYVERKNVIEDKMDGATAHKYMLELQELKYRIFVMETLKVFTDAVPDINDGKAVKFYSGALSAFLRELPLDHAFAPKADDEGLQRRETAVEALQEVCDDACGKLKKYQPSAQDLYKKEITKIIKPITTVWVQYRNTLIEVGAQSKEKSSKKAEPKETDLVKKAMQVSCPIRKFAGLTLGEVLRKDPNAIKFLAEKYSGEDKVREAAKTLCEYAIKQSA